MNVRMKQRALQLTEYVLQQFWMRNTKEVLKYFHEHIMWIGSMKSEYVFGKEAVKARIQEVTTNVPQVYMTNQQYSIVHTDANTCTVAGMYVAFTNPFSGQILSETQRVTFIWIVVKGELKIIHLHLSNTLHIQDEDENFPTRAGKETYEYLQKIIDKQSSSNNLVFRDTQKVEHVIARLDIRYLEAEKEYTLIHCTNKSIRVTGTITKILKTLPEEFVQIHRSYVININHIKCINNCTVTLEDETVLHIPVKRFKEVRDSILNKRK